MTQLQAQILENVDQIVIRQHLSVVEAVTGFDRLNRYNIWDGKTGSQIFTAKEGDIGCCTRNCFQVIIHFYHLFVLYRPFAERASKIKVEAIVFSLHFSFIGLF